MVIRKQELMLKYANEIESMTGVKPYGLEKEIDESKVKGYTRLQEILENVVGGGGPSNT